MDLMCSLFSQKQAETNSTRIYAMCVDKAAPTSTTPRTPNTMMNKLAVKAHHYHQHSTTSRPSVFEKAEVYHHKQVPGKHATTSSNNNSNINTFFYDDHGAAMFVIVVICFYSLSIGFMLISNIKCRCVIARKTTGWCCLEIKAADTAYDVQLDETKRTINLIFNDSSKLLTSVVLPPSVINNLTSTSATNFAVAANNNTNNRVSAIKTAADSQGNERTTSERLWQRDDEYIPHLDAIV